MFSIKIDISAKTQRKYVVLTFQGDTCIEFFPWRPELILKMRDFDQGCFDDSQFGLNSEPGAENDPEPNDGRFTIEWVEDPKYILWESATAGDFSRRGIISGKIPKTPDSMNSLRECFDAWRTAFQN